MKLHSSISRVISGTKGFTIVELLIVIVIIAILAGLVITTFVGIQEKARTTKMVNDIKSIQRTIEAYYATYGNYPNTANAWRFQRSVGDNFIPGVVPDIVSKLPQVTDGSTSSPTNNTYIYRSNASGSEYKLMRLNQPSVSAGERSNVPSGMLDPNASLLDRWGVWSPGGSGI